MGTDRMGPDVTNTDHKISIASQPITTLPETQIIIREYHHHHHQQDQQQNQQQFSLPVSLSPANSLTYGTEYSVNTTKMTTTVNTMNMLHPGDYRNQVSGYGGGGVHLQIFSRQGSSASGGGINRESSQDDSGVVDDHEELDLTASDAMTPRHLGKQQELVPVTLALSPREVRLIKCNGNFARYKNHNNHHRHSIYALHPADYSQEIIVIGNKKKNESLM